MEFDARFPALYDCEVLDELPNRASPRWYFPGGTQLGGRSGLIVGIQPDVGDEWVGVFAFGDVSMRGVNAVLSMPNSRQLCVVSRGAGYIVDAVSAREIEAISMTPIFAVVPVPAKALVLMHDFSRVRAYGRDGLAWSTPAISWDGIEILEVTDTALRGTAWDSPNNKHVPFAIDLATGSHEGGASPELLRTCLR
jgi:hypothetical protein